MINAKEIKEHPLRQIDWDFKNSNKSLSIHSIHPYPAKFIPEIPRAIIENISFPDRTAILDPFCGSGVTLLESQIAGHESFGVDLNPIACLISKIKTGNSLPENLKNKSLELVFNSKQNVKNVKIPDIPNLNHWFKKGVQLALATLTDQIFKTKDLTLKEIYKVAVSSIIVKVSNQDSDTRYAAVSKDVDYDLVFDLFLNSIDRLIKFIPKNKKNRQQSTILNKNILELDVKLINRPIGLVVTSPPYPNAYEYWLYHKYRMWWLGYDPIDVKNKEIGARAHYFKKNHQTAADFETQMNQIFYKLSQLVVNDGKVIMVTGNSKIHGEIIANETIIANAGKLNGFVLDDIITRNMNSNRKSFNLNHARIKQEHIVILRKV
ncbi:DNA methyltransferase [Ascidiimonas sp. W6]|uniref:DNA methyltransferase n=1 Tax=Ascidiimonas meishanensis TaxID=3128903 RepID=UPI0030EC4BD2